MLYKVVYLERLANLLFVTSYVNNGFVKYDTFFSLNTYSLNVHLIIAFTFTSILDRIQKDVVAKEKLH